MKTLRIYFQQLSYTLYISAIYRYYVLHYIPSIYLRLEVCTFDRLPPVSPTYTLNL